MKKTTHGAVTIIEEKIDSTFNLWSMFCSDVHLDSVYCDREAFFADLDDAKARNARVYIFGDLFDAMQGRFDPRRSMEELRPEYRRADYYDFVIKDAARLLKPYASNIELIARGNHETSVLKNANTDLIDRLVYVLNVENGTTITTGGYGGWVMWRLDSGAKHTIRMKYFHGSGGEAPVTRGAIQTNRQAVYLPEADMVVNGHSHNSYYIPISRERVTDSGRQYFDLQHHIRVPGYKQSYGDGTSGWEVERGGVPKPIGCAYVEMRLIYPRVSQGITNRGGAIDVQVYPRVRGGEAISSTPGMYTGAVYAQDSEGA